MTDQELRLECVRQAAVTFLGRAGDERKLLEVAREIYDFCSGKPAKPPVKVAA